MSETPGPRVLPTLLNVFFYGFRATRGHGRMLMAVALLFGLLGAGLGPGLATAAVDFTRAFDAYQALGTPSEITPEVERLRNAIFGSAGRVLAYFLLFAFASVLAQAAILRALVRDTSQGGVFGLWLGRDEWLVGCVSVIVFGITLGAQLVVEQLAFLLMQAGLGQLVALIGLVALIWLQARLAPAAAVSVGENRVAIREAWRLTDGRVFPLFAMLLVNLAVFYLGFVLLAAVLNGITPNPSSDDAGVVIESLTNPLARLQFALLAAYVPVGMLGVFGVGAYAYREWGAALGLNGAYPPWSDTNPRDP